jgi:GcrA cell cycle regulator
VALPQAFAGAVSKTELFKADKIPHLTLGIPIMSWTEQQIQMLKDMWGHGFSASDIAGRLGGGLTRNAVIGKAHRLKLSAGLAARGAGSPGMRPAPSAGMADIKSSRKRVMLRPLPVLPTPSGTTSAKPVQREAFRSPADPAKRSEGIAVTKAGDRHCRWPVGDPRSPDFRFCGCTVHEGLPYCTDHARVAYQNVGKKFRAAENSETPQVQRITQTH